MIRTHKIALNPSSRHLSLLEQCATSARDGYNGALAYFKETLDAGEPCPAGMLFPMWKGIQPPLCPPLDKACQSAAQYAVYALEGAIKAWQDKARNNEFPAPMPRTTDPPSAPPRAAFAAKANASNCPTSAAFACMSPCVLRAVSPW